MDGCERILRDEFKDYPESALYMIGAINEAKGKAKPGTRAAPTEAKSKARADLTPAAKSTANATPEPHSILGAKPQPTLEHAGNAHES